MSRITPLDPTERYKHVLTMVQVVFYQKNTGSTTKNALGDWYDDSLNDVKNANFRKKIHLVSPPYILQNAKNMCKRCCS